MDVFFHGLLEGKALHNFHRIFIQPDSQTRIINQTRQLVRKILGIFRLRQETAHTVFDSFRDSTNPRGNDRKPTN